MVGIKLYFSYPFNEIRRIEVQKESTFDQLQNYVYGVIRDLTKHVLLEDLILSSAKGMIGLEKYPSHTNPNVLKVELIYLDDEQDLVRISNDLEWKEAVRIFDIHSKRDPTSVLRIEVVTTLNHRTSNDHSIAITQYGHDQHEKDHNHKQHSSDHQNSKYHVMTSGCSNGGGVPRVSMKHTRTSDVPPSPTHLRMVFLNSPQGFLSNSGNFNELIGDHAHTSINNQGNNQNNIINNNNINNNNNNKKKKNKNKKTTQSTEEKAMYSDQCTETPGGIRNEDEMHNTKVQTKKRIIPIDDMESTIQYDCDANEGNEKVNVKNNHQGSDPCDTIEENSLLSTEEVKEEQKKGNEKTSQEGDHCMHTEDEETDKTTKEKRMLNTLESMGFKDHQLNRDLISKCGTDLEKVVSHLVVQNQSTQ